MNLKKITGLEKVIFKLILITHFIPFLRMQWVHTEEATNLSEEECKLNPAAWETLFTDTIVQQWKNENK